MPNLLLSRWLVLTWRHFCKTSYYKMMTVSRFSHQNDAGFRVLTVVLWENLVLVVVLILESKGAFDWPYSGIRIRGVMIKTVCLALFEAAATIVQICLKYLTIIPRARMGSESIDHEAEGWMGYWLRGHEGERNNCFSKIQLVGQKNIETKYLSLVKARL